MAKNNYPQGSLDDIAPVEIKQMVSSLKQLHDMGKPKTDNEVAERVDLFFEFCQTSCLRPGIESLCLALHISRTTLYRWSNGEDCSSYRQEIIQSAKGFIGAFLEQAMVNGRINPASGIFLMKNWLSYKDSISVEEALPQIDKKKALSSAELPRLKPITVNTTEVSDSCNGALGSNKLPRFINEN